MSQNTSELRNKLKDERRKLSTPFMHAAADAIAHRLNHLRLLQRTSTVAAYMASHGEVDCQPIIQQLILRKKSVFLPIIEKNRLFFAPYRDSSMMIRNRYNILEPVYRNAELIATKRLDAVIVPLVAFDKKLNRIGMGGGYYDRCFAARKHQGGWRKPLLIGVAYEFQRVEVIQPNAWDIPLDAVVTENKCYGSC